METIDQTNTNQTTLRLPILIAEDNPTNRLVIQAILERHGCPYEFAVNGSDAVEKYRKGRYSMILMDCQMPEVNGFQATSVIRLHENTLSRERCPIIAVTANAMSGDRDKCIAAGMDDFLAKPFKSQELMSLVRRWAIGWEGLS